MSEQNQETVVFNSVLEAVEHVNKLRKEAEESVARYHQAIFEFTGIRPGQTLNPMDIVNLVLKFKDAQ